MAFYDSRVQTPACGQADHTHTAAVQPAATVLPNWGRGRDRIKTGSSKVSFLSSAFTHFVFTNLSPCQCLCSLRELFGTSQTWKSQGEITVTDVSLLGGDTQGGAEPLHAAKK